MIDNTRGFESMSFMDGFSGYYQIKMYLDENTYIILNTVGCVLLYGYSICLKERRWHLPAYNEHNLSWLLAKDSDLLYWRHCNKKSRQEQPSPRFENNVRSQVHQLKMNPTKSFLGVSSGKFLGFIVTSKGIHLDLDKIKAIQDMQLPKNLKELRGLQGKLAYIWRFIVNLSGRVNHSHA